MSRLLILLFLATSNFLFAQTEIPVSSNNCTIHKKNNFTYCLNETNYKTQWTAVQIKGTDIENKIYLPPDSEFFKDMPESIQSLWKTIETQTQVWSMMFDSIFVVTGIKEFEKDSIAEQAYFKAILKGCKGDGLGFWVSTNAVETDIVNYALTIDELEELTEMDFFPGLDKDLQSIFEANFNWEFWPVFVE
jgi:DNA/RNA endonuclease G (NUC1)